MDWGDVLVSIVMAYGVGGQVALLIDDALRCPDGLQRRVFLFIAGGGTFSWFAILLR
jgi:hypothetical protein